MNILNKKKLNGNKTDDNQGNVGNSIKRMILGITGSILLALSLGNLDVVAATTTTATMENEDYIQTPEYQAMLETAANGSQEERRQSIAEYFNKYFKGYIDRNDLDTIFGGLEFDLSDTARQVFNESLSVENVIVESDWIVDIKAMYKARRTINGDTYEALSKDDQIDVLKEFKDNGLTIVLTEGKMTMSELKDAGIITDDGTLVAVSEEIINNDEEDGREFNKLNGYSHIIDNYGHNLIYVKNEIGLLGAFNFFVPFEGDEGIEGIDKQKVEGIRRLCAWVEENIDEEDQAEYIVDIIFQIAAIDSDFKDLDLEYVKKIIEIMGVEVCEENSEEIVINIQGEKKSIKVKYEQNIAIGEFYNQESEKTVDLAYVEAVINQMFYGNLNPVAEIKRWCENNLDSGEIDVLEYLKAHMEILKPFIEELQAIELPQSTQSQTGDSTQTQFTSTFADITTSDWYYNPTHTLFNQGIMNGVIKEDGLRYALPNDDIKNCEVVTLMAKASGLTIDNTIVGNHWSEAYYQALGISSDELTPEEYMNRYVLASMMADVLELLGETDDIDLEEALGKASEGLVDFASIPEVYQEDVAILYALGITAGSTNDVGETIYDGNKTISRAVAITMTARVVDESLRIDH